MDDSALALNRVLQLLAAGSRKTLDTVISNLATTHSVDGKFLINGAGEASQFVKFPVSFIERPNFVTGGELNPGSVATSGSYPTISCVISSWEIQQLGNAGFAKEYFTGAYILVVTTGVSTQKMWVHWRATGRALSNPAGDQDIASDGFV